MAVYFDPLIADYFEFSEEEMKISYNGTVIEGISDRVKMIDLLITYIDANGWETFV